jgi:hypothetical protein
MKHPENAQVLFLHPQERSAVAMKTLVLPGVILARPVQLKAPINSNLSVVLLPSYHLDLMVSVLRLKHFVRTVSV